MHSHRELEISYDTRSRIRGKSHKRSASRDGDHHRTWKEKSQDKRKRVNDSMLENNCRQEERRGRSEGGHHQEAMRTSLGTGTLSWAAQFPWRHSPCINGFLAKNVMKQRHDESCLRVHMYSRHPDIYSIPLHQIALSILVLIVMCNFHHIFLNG